MFQRNISMQILSLMLVIPTLPLFPLILSPLPHSSLSLLLSLSISLMVVLSQEEISL